MTGHRHPLCPGETTFDMLMAPKGAMYLWAHGDLDYPQRLAAHLGRTDLTVVAPGWLRRMDLAAGTNKLPVVVDHALSVASLCELQLHGLIVLRLRQARAKRLQ